MMKTNPSQSLRIGLWGFGRMGQAVAAVAESMGDTIVWALDRQKAEQMNDASFHEVDVVIEFTLPESAPEIVKKCLSHGIPVVSGTTGWNDKLLDMGSLAIQQDTAFLHASNFSIGVNLFFAINHMASSMMAQHPSYLPTIKEVHHLHKKDAPSGTAITLADTVIQASHGLYTDWVSDKSEKEEWIPIESIREGDAPGFHEIIWRGESDQLAFVHEAFNREGFARGAWQAAHYIRDKKGHFTMRDVLGLQKWYNL